MFRIFKVKKGIKIWYEIEEFVQHSSLPEKWYKITSPLWGITKKFKTVDDAENYLRKGHEIRTLVKEFDI